MNAPLQRDLFANAGRTDYTTRRSRRRRCSTWSGRSCPRRIRSSRELDRAGVRDRRRPPSAAWSITGAITLRRRCSASAFGAAFGIGLAVLIVMSMRCSRRSLMPWIVASQTVPIIALAPMIVVILNQFDITGVVAQGGDRRLSVVLSRHRRHGQGLALARPLQLDLMRTYSRRGRRLFSSCARRRARRSSSPA